MGLDYADIRKKIEGKRYICEVRCSTDGQSDTSIPAQLEELHKIGQLCGGIPAGDDVVLPALSGSKPGNRKDIQQTIQRKAEKNDFEVVLSLVEDRFTRSGAEHGFWAQHEMLRAGIYLVQVKSDIPDGPHAPMLRTWKYESARETAKNTSLRSTMGYQRALENGNVITSSHTNYGTYRLYLNADGRPLHIIKDMRDGTQQKLHCETREVIEIYGVVGGKARGHFRKQKSDRVLLVPGDPQEVATINRIFQRRYLDGWGGRRIANELNDEGITAPMGKRWTQRQVDCIAENLIYTGCGVAGLSSSAVFYMRSKDGPTPVQIDPVVLATKANLPVNLRPPEEWTFQEQRYLKDLLPQPLRDIAHQKIKTLWEQRCRGDVAPHVRNTHLDSLYLLTGLIRAKQDGRLLKGQNCGPRDHPVRYYAHPIARKDPKAAGFPNTTFRADALETALLKTVSETLLAMPDLRDELRLAVEAARAADAPPASTTLSELQQELGKLNKDIKSAVDLFGEVAVPELKQKLVQLQARRQQLERQIRQAQVSPQAPAGEIEQTIESLVQRLGNLAGQIESLPAYQLRQMLAALTDTLTADMATREVTMTLRVPPRAISDAKTPISDLCLRYSSGSPTESQAQITAPPVLARIHCAHHSEGGKPCYRCRRVPKAA